MKILDRIAVGVAAALCLLMPYYPATTTSLPVMGTRVASGYDVVVLGDMEKVTEQLQIAMDQFDKHRKPGSERPDAPLSMKLAKLIKLSLALAFVSGAVVLVGAFVSDLIVILGAVAGMAFSFAALLHMLLFNADMHLYMHNQIGQIQRGEGQNPFAGLERGMIELMSGGFNLEPGFGLYTMTIAFFACFFFAQTKLLSRVSKALDRRSRSRQRVQESDRPDLW